MSMGANGSARGGAGRPGRRRACIEERRLLPARRDGGDAETGFGGLGVAAPRYGLMANLKGRALIAHETDGFREGARAGASIRARPASAASR